MYYFNPIFRTPDGKTFTPLGTFAKRTFSGSALSRVLRNYKDQWFGKKDMHGNFIIGVEVEYCVRTFSDPESTNRYIFS